MKQIVEIVWPFVIGLMIGMMIGAWATAEPPPPRLLEAPAENPPEDAMNVSRELRGIRAELQRIHDRMDKIAEPTPGFAYYSNAVVQRPQILRK